MYRALLVALLGIVPATDALADERNYTLRGDGWFDGNNARFGRLPMREVRMTLRDNGEFAVTLFVRNERYLVRGRWDRRGRGNVERIDLNQALGQRASGNGTLHYARNGNTPERLFIEGRTRDGAFRAEITDERGFDWNDRRDRDERARFELGRNGRLYEDLQLDARGNGTLRMSRVRDGRVNAVRAQLRTNRDVRIDLDRPTAGTIRGEIIAVTGNQVRVRVQEVLGVRANGEIEIVVRDRNELSTIRGAGGSDDGSWQLDFDGNGRGGRWEENDRDDRTGGFGAFESNDRGNGRLRQDVGPDLEFDRMRVRLEANGSAWIGLDGRRQSVQLRGTWRADGRDVRIDLDAINEMSARGRLTLERSGTRVDRLQGDGRTDRGRFDVRFAR
jgi:hypothetical protein